VSDIDCVAAIGVTPEERTMKQRLSVDVEVTTDVRKAAGSDSLKDALDYAEVVRLVVKLADSRDFHLIETFAELIAGRVLSDLTGDTVRVVVRKLTPVLSSRVRFVSVEIVRARGASDV
jgi:dihydroneopterin aldolase